MVGVITTVLVGFVAISLIVSSIMIAIITYISVLERTKVESYVQWGFEERYPSHLYCETAIEGFDSGVLGIT